MFCGNCGKENADESNFCTQCGQSLRPGEEIQQYPQPGPPSQYQQQQPPLYGQPDMKETFKHSAVSGAGTFAGCCCMNALTSMLCDACE